MQNNKAIAINQSGIIIMGTKQNTRRTECFEPTRHIYARYSNLFLVLMVISIILVQRGVVVGGYIYYVPMIITLWCAMAAGLLSTAYQANDYSAIGKIDSGEQLWYGKLSFIPYLIPLWIRQFLITRCTKEPAYNELIAGVFIGRRLSKASQLPEGCTTIVDLAAEFPEAKSIRKLSGYRSFPILEASVRSKEELCDFIKTLPESGIYIHCGQGHGRTGFFAAAFLLCRGVARTLEEAEAMLVKARPRLKLRKSGKAVLSQYFNS